MFLFSAVAQYETASQGENHGAGRWETQAGVLQSPTGYVKIKHTRHKTSPENVFLAAQ